MVIPFGAGLILGLLLPAQYLAAPDQRLIFALFMAVAIAISAVPVIAKILIELGLMRRELGMLILAAGIIDVGPDGMQSSAQLVAVRREVKKLLGESK